MFGSKTKRIKELETQVEDLKSTIAVKQGILESQYNKIDMLDEHLKSLEQEMSDLTFQRDTLASLLKQIRFDVKLPLRKVKEDAASV